MCSKSESGFWFHFEKYRRRRVQIFLRTRKQYPAGSIQTCVHPWRLGKVEWFSQQTDFIESFSWERMNTKWRFYKLKNLTVFAALLKVVPMGCKDAVLLNLYWEMVQSTVSLLKKIQDNHIMTTCVFFVLLLSICTEINDWKKKFRNYSI